MPSAWTIEDGCIKINESGMGEAGAKDGGDIIFANKKFKNFELAFDWKVDKGANSGVFYLAQRFRTNRFTSPLRNHQVLDNENHPDAKLGRRRHRQSASLYDMIPAKPQNSKTVRRMEYGQNLVYDGTVAHFQNGTGRGIPLVDPEVERDARQQQNSASDKWPEASTNCC